MKTPQTDPHAAVLFADISGSTRLYERLGDQLALQYIASYLHKLQSVSSRFGGQAVKTIGDAVMFTFPDADSALRAAVDMQLDTINRPDLSEHGATIHIGFHFGPVTRENNDVFGDTVNIAAHLTGIARSGQILTSSQIVDNLSAWLRLGLRQIDTLAVKGKQETTRIYEVIWKDSDDLTMIPDRPALAPRQDTVLQLEYGGSRYTLSATKPTLTLGRSQESDLVLMDRLASREHARIEYRRNKAILVDTSTNGTYVTLEDNQEIFIRREELVLPASGSLCFGHSAKNDASNIVRFTCS